MKVAHFPLVKVSACFIFGLVVFPHLITSHNTQLILATAIVLFICGIFAQIFLKQIFSLVILTLAIVCGFHTFIIHQESLQRSHYLYFTSPELQRIEIVLQEKLKSTPSSIRYIANVRKIDGKNCTGKILLNIYQSDFKNTLEIGSRLSLKSMIIEHRKPMNPGQFDYGRYLANKSIYAQLFTPAENILINSQPEKDLWYFSDKLRQRIVNNLATEFKPSELQMINALILGQRQEIGADIIRDYQYAGAIHILSVSGLHVGFIVLFLNFALRPLPRTARYNLVKLLITLSFLWSFALIASLSPSVVRSVTMFSIVACGMYLRRSSNIFHTLIISIFVILFFQPSFAFDVGFQLSYLALFFILWLQPMLAELFTPTSKIIKYFWDIITVSVAAQIGALPISIYYFHQFPGLFFVTNLVVIPIISLIMVLGIIVIIISACNIVLSFPIKILEWCIVFMNYTISKIASFEMFVIKDIPLTIFMLVASYTLIISLILCWKKPSILKYFTVLLSIILLQISFFSARADAAKKDELVIFHLKGRSLLIDQKGQEAIVYGDKPTIDELKDNTSLNSYLTANFSKVQLATLLKNVFTYNGKRILIIDSLEIVPGHVRPDVLMIVQSPHINLERVLKTLNPDIVVADGSNYKTYGKRWEATCRKNKIPFHFTSEKGFFTISK